MFISQQTSKLNFHYWALNGVCTHDLEDNEKRKAENQVAKLHFQ